MHENRELSVNRLKILLSRRAREIKRYSSNKYFELLFNSSRELRIFEFLDNIIMV